MNPCIVCRRFTQDNIKTVEDAIDGIKIRHILSDLNYKFPFGDYMTNRICVKCSYDLEEMYKFRDSICGLFDCFEESNNNMCLICSNSENVEDFSDNVTANEHLSKALEILNDICGYEMNIKIDKVCKKCYDSLTNINKFRIKCSKSLNFWTDHVLETSSVCTNLTINEANDYPFNGNLASMENSLTQRINRNDYFECATCSKLCSTKTSLKYHLKSHTAEKPFKCEICSKSFRHKAILKVHLKIHTGEKPHRCKICLKSFTHSSNLKIHLKTHIDERLYKCELCLKSFKRESDLKIHLKIHSNEKP